MFRGGASCRRTGARSLAPSHARIQFVPRRFNTSFFARPSPDELPPALRNPPPPPRLEDVPTIRKSERALIGKLTGLPRRASPILLRVAYLSYGQMQLHVKQPVWTEKVKLPDTFNSWFAVSLLHTWMLMYKLREDLFDGPRIQTNIVNLFWSDVEQNLVKAGLTQGLIYSKHLTEYAKRYYGVLVAFDEAIQQGDIQLTEALWRNIFQMEVNSADSLPRLYNILRYTRAQLHNLDSQPLDVITMGHIKWLSFEAAIATPLSSSTPPPPSTRPSSPPPPPKAKNS